MPIQISYCIYHLTTFINFVNRTEIGTVVNRILLVYFCGQFKYWDGCKVSAVLSGPATSLKVYHYGNLNNILYLYSYDHILPFRKGNDDARWFKRTIAKELNEIHLEMKTLLINKQIPSARLVQRLGGIVKRLDNSLQPSTTRV